MKKIVRRISTAVCAVALFCEIGAAGASDRGTDIKKLAVWMVVWFMVFATCAVVRRVTE